jgi:hypothetical protein
MAKKAKKGSKTPQQSCCGYRPSTKKYKAKVRCASGKQQTIYGHQTCKPGAGTLKPGRCKGGASGTTYVHKYTRCAPVKGRPAPGSTPRPKRKCLCKA